jgi:hypothetical protein
MCLSQSSISSFLPSPAAILCHRQAFRTVIYWDQYLARKWWLQWVYSSYYPSGHGHGCGEAASDVELGEFRKGRDLLAIYYNDGKHGCSGGTLLLTDVIGVDRIIQKRLRSHLMCHLMYVIYVPFCN